LNIKFLSCHWWYDKCNDEVQQDSFNLASADATVLIIQHFPRLEVLFLYQKKAWSVNKQIWGTCSERHPAVCVHQTVVVSPDHLSPTPSVFFSCGDFIKQKTTLMTMKRQIRRNPNGTPLVSFAAQV